MTVFGPNNQECSMSRSSAEPARSTGAPVNPLTGSLPVPTIPVRGQENRLPTVNFPENCPPRDTASSPGAQTFNYAASQVRHF